MLSPFVHSLIRTATPTLVGMLAAWLTVTFAVEVPDELLVELTAAITGIALMLYYLAARLIEQRVPSLSWLLGSPSRPVAYESPRGDLVVDRTPSSNA